MENQLIRGQVFDVLFNYAEKWGSICTESDCATVRDEICLRIDQSQFTADEAEDYINQEVEKRIAKVLPTKNEIGNACQLFDKQKRPLWKEAIWRAGANWVVDLIRSRLSHESEGGEG